MGMCEIKMQIPTARGRIVTLYTKYSLSIQTQTLQGILQVNKLPVF